LAARAEELAAQAKAAADEVRACVRGNMSACATFMALSQGPFVLKVSAASWLIHILPPYLLLSISS
jgi:hypothetical protein